MTGCQSRARVISRLCYSSREFTDDKNLVTPSKLRRYRSPKNAAPINPSRVSPRRAPPSSAARCADRSTARYSSRVSRNSSMYSAASGSPVSLGYAVEQFFDNGGREALIVRVVNGARSATLTLKAGCAGAQAASAAPGYPGILAGQRRLRQHCAGSGSAFQSDRAAGARAGHRAGRRSGNIPSPVDIAGGGTLFAERDLAQSALIRLVGEVPTQRPDRTLDPASGLATAYVHSNSDGDDGAPLTDYDLIGSSLGSHRRCSRCITPNTSISCAFRRCRAIRMWARALCWSRRAIARSAARC